MAVNWRSSEYNFLQFVTCGQDVSLFNVFAILMDKEGHIKVAPVDEIDFALPSLAMEAFLHRR